MGEILVVLTACGHRLDRIMGERDFRAIQQRLYHAGLLTEHGEPTRIGSAAADAFLAKRDAAARTAEETAENRLRVNQHMTVQVAKS